MKTIDCTCSRGGNAAFCECHDIVTLEAEFGCDPWDDENNGSHPASKQEDPFRVVRPTNGGR